jgi:hypothetical protein
MKALAQLAHHGMELGHIHESVGVCIEGLKCSPHLIACQHEAAGANTCKLHLASCLVDPVGDLRGRAANVDLTRVKPEKTSITEDKW